MTVFESQESGYLGDTPVLVLVTACDVGGETLTYFCPNQENVNFRSMLTTVQCLRVYSWCSISKCSMCFKLLFFI